MSNDAAGHVTRFSPYKRSEHAVLVAIADTVNDLNNNEFWMRAKVLAAKSRVSIGTVRKALRTYCDDGWLVQLTANKDTGGPSRYRFVFDDSRAVVFESREYHERQPDGRVKREGGRSDDPLEGGRSEQRVTHPVATGYPPSSNGVTSDARHNSIELNTTQPTTDVPASPKPRRSAVPDGYEPRPADVASAARAGLDFDGDGFGAETEQFVDHHRAKGSRMADWDAAWRTWMRSSYRKRPAAAPAARLRPGMQRLGDLGSAMRANGRDPFGLTEPSQATLTLEQGDTAR